MPTISNFDPPANVDDFDSIPDQRAAWDEFISLSFQRNIESVTRSIGAGNCQYYNPKVTSTDPPVASDVIRWKGFPLVIASRHPGNKPAAFAEAEQLQGGPGNRFRPQDEYLEWRVTRNAAGKVTQVIFTCEGPEYWEALCDGYPFEYTIPVNQGGLGGVKHTQAKGDRTKLLALYRQFVSPDVQLADLLDEFDRYNRQNKWNTTDGIMHLSHGANTLGAEINIAARATILRKGANNVIITNPNTLIQCPPSFGLRKRASDPHIGDEVNKLARGGFAITLQNPVGLYIDGVPEGIDSWVTPDGTPARQFWSVLRGTPEMTLRAVFEVPAAKGFTVGDIKIGGKAIAFGGAIAEKTNVKLTGLACRQGSFHNAGIRCQSGSPGFAALAADPADDPETSLPSRG